MNLRIQQFNLTVFPKRILFAKQNNNQYWCIFLGSSAEKDSGKNADKSYPERTFPDILFPHLGSQFHSNKLPFDQRFGQLQLKIISLSFCVIVNILVQIKHNNNLTSQELHPLYK